MHRNGDTHPYKVSPARLTHWISALLLVSCLTGCENPFIKKTQWPLKTARTLYSQTQVALARSRASLTTNAEIQRVLIRTRRDGDPWLAVPLSELKLRIADSSVPRAFNDSVGGSPNPAIGKQIFSRGTYPWLLDFNKPYKLICPITGEIYPDNDFAAYYRSNYTDSSRNVVAQPNHWGGKVIDTGWGWVNPATGEKHWLVAHANAEWWRKLIVPGVLSLSRMYVITGDRKYADQAAAMLARIADIYPAMDHQTQSRFGSMMPNYPGKVLNYVAETFLITDLAEAYDNIWETIDSNRALQSFRKQSGAQIRDTIEANLLEEGIRGVYAKKIYGNFGMHQKALARLLRVRQHAPDRLRQDIIADTQPGSEYPYERLIDAFYNNIHRDGSGLESPAYNIGWLNDMVELSKMFDPTQFDLLAEPQIARLFRSFSELVIGGSTPAPPKTPALGDSGGYDAALVSGLFYREAFAKFRTNPTLVSDMAYMYSKAGGDLETFRTYFDLFEPEILSDLRQVRASLPRLPKATRVLDGYGLAILSNPKETVSLSLSYGPHLQHHHRGGLHFDLFAWGNALTPDQGYPDFMNAYVPGVYSWTLGTMSHNTVQVNRTMQRVWPIGGMLHHLASTDKIQWVDAENRERYQGIEEYRRSMALISTNDDHAYVVDVFRSKGGTQHDYSLHGAVGSREIVSGDFSPPQLNGTLAGENVAVGALYDSPVHSAPDYKGVYSNYSGSSFQHFVQPQWQIGTANVILDIEQTRSSLVPNPGMLRMIIPHQDGSKVILASAAVSPVKNADKLLPYTIVRRSGTAPLTSTFVSVLDPYKIGSAPVIRNSTFVPTSPGSGVVALNVLREDATRDLIWMAPNAASVRTTTDQSLKTDSPLVVIHHSSNGTPLWGQAHGGTQLVYRGLSHALKPHSRGLVESIDWRGNSIIVRWTGTPPAPAELIAKPVFLEATGRSHLFTIERAQASATNGTLRLFFKESILNGHGKIDSFNSVTKEAHTPTPLPFGAMYLGMTFYSGDFSRQFSITGYRRPSAAAADGHFKFAWDPAREAPPSTPSEFWISVIAPGMPLRFERTTQLSF